MDLDKEPIIEELTELDVDEQIKCLEDELPYVREEIKDWENGQVCYNCYLHSNVPDTQLMCPRCGTPFIDKEQKEIPNNLLVKEREILNKIDGLKSLGDIMILSKDGTVAEKTKGEIADIIEEAGADEDIYIDPRLVVDEKDII